MRAAYPVKVSRLCHVVLPRPDRVHAGREKRDHGDAVHEPDCSRVRRSSLSLLDALNHAERADARRGGESSLQRTHCLLARLEKPTDTPVDLVKAERGAAAYETDHAGSAAVAMGQGCGVGGTEERDADEEEVHRLHALRRVEGEPVPGVSETILVRARSRLRPRRLAAGHHHGHRCDGTRWEYRLAQCDS